MKKLLLLAVPAVMMAAVSCTKDQKEEIKKPAQYSWFLNSETLNVVDMNINDTFNRVIYTDHKTNSVKFLFAKLPTQDGTYTIRAVADEVDEISIAAMDSAANVLYNSMDDDGYKHDQFAKVSVNGGKLSIVFDQVWLKDYNTSKLAKVSVNF